jgi:isoaspartyl peptidase/L-asparaginase-like protein (Ntn-hydrolase superfamily)
MYAIAIHGGAGVVPRDLLTSGKEKAYRAGLESALDSAYAILERGGSSLDAVSTAVRILEDDPLFNAGHGAALTRDGAAELDAAIMDGKQQRAGAVASLRHVKNPIDLARRVMEKSRHVLLVGPTSAVPWNTGVSRSRRRHEKCYTASFKDSGQRRNHRGEWRGTGRHGLQHRGDVSRRAGFRRAPRGGYLLKCGEQPPRPKTPEINSMQAVQFPGSR